MSVYTDLGLKPIINASGAVTRLGGAPMPEAVLTAFRVAAAECVPIEELQGVASEVISEITGAESGLATAGAAASLTLGAAAMLTGLDPGRMEQLPNTRGMANEIIVAREQRNGYDHCVRASGVSLVEIGMNEIVGNAGVRRTEIWEYEAAIGPGTAGILYNYGRHSEPDLRNVVDLAHERDLPVLVDAAGELPPKSNLQDVATTGADLVCFSGGKAIRGVQSTGILCGRRDLIAAAALQMLDMDEHWELWSPPPALIDKSLLPGLPRHGIGRGFKVSKEEIVALLTGLRLFADGAYDNDYDVGLELLRSIADELADNPVSCWLEEDPQCERLPQLTIEIDEDAIGTTAMEICRNLRKGDPPIYVGHGMLKQARLVINPLHLKREDGVTIAIAVKRLLQCS